MKFLTLFAALFAGFFAQAQFTKPTSKLFTAADGKLVAEFTDSIKIAIGPQESGWYATTTKVYVEKTAVTEDSVLAAETELLDATKTAIGKTSAETKVVFKQAEGRGFYKYYEVLISGYMKSYSIEYKSIPEKGLEDIMEEKNMTVRQERLDAFFTKMGFEQSEIEGYTVWAYLDKVATLEAEAHYRTIVVFRGETALFCIISKHETLTLEKIKDTKQDKTGNYFFFQKAQENAIKQMQNIAYSFIPL